MATAAYSGFTFAGGYTNTGSTTLQSTNSLQWVDTPDGTIIDNTEYNLASTGEYIAGLDNSQYVAVHHSPAAYATFPTETAEDDAHTTAIKEVYIKTLTFTSDLTDLSKKKLSFTRTMTALNMQGYFCTPSFILPFIWNGPSGD